MGGKTEKTTPSGGQDKGHGAGLAAFVKAVAAGGAAPVDEAEIVETSLATIAAAESLRSGGRIYLNGAPDGS